MTTSGTTSDNEWQPMRTSGKTNGNEWQWVTTSDTMNENKWKQMRASKREWFWVQNETKHAMYSYNILRNTDYL